MAELWYADLGRIGYSQCLTIQGRLAEMRTRGEVPDTLLLLEHDPVITFGRSGGEQSLLVSLDDVRKAGVETFETDRGGDATYHGPGQLVGYPIFDLNGHGRDVHLFLRNIEGAVIECLARFGISGETEHRLTGVWVGGEKICSIGIAVRRWVSYHGFALNVSPDFGHWALLRPCGLVGRKVTSIKRLLGSDPGMQAVKDAAVQSFAQVFGMDPVQVAPDSLLDGVMT